MTETEKKPASVYLTEAAIAYLKEKATENNNTYTFERSELVKHLTEAWQDERNTEGARTGALNRLFDSSGHLNKVGHGKYLYSNNILLTTDNLISEIQQCYDNINAITIGLTIADTFNADDRRLIYKAQVALDTLEELKETLKK